MPALAPVEPPPHVPAAHVRDFDMYAPPDVAHGFHESWAALQAGAPEMVWTPRNGGHWIAARGRLIAEIFADHRRFTSRVIMVPKADGEHHNMIPTTIDPPQHRPYRMLLNAGLAPGIVEALEPRVRAIAARLIDAVLPAGRCDFIAAYAEKLPIELFLELVDLPLSDAPYLKRLTDQITRPDGSVSFPDAVAAFHAYLAPVVAERRAAPQDDFLSRLVTGEVDGRALSDHEALQLAAQVLIAGLDTVVNFLGFAVLWLAREPGWQARLAADPAQLPGVVAELFRRLPIVTIGREVRADVEFGGVALKAGEMVMCPTALHGLDPGLNPDPFTVDPDRPAPEHSTFGQGNHRCPGAALARMEVRVTLEEWLERVPSFAVAPGAATPTAGGIVGTVLTLPLIWPAP